MILPGVALEEPKIYVRKYKPDHWLFPGADADRFLTERSVQKVFENARFKAGIKKEVTVHSLRHSFAIHHQSSKTTEIYTHVTEKSLRNIVSPLDRILSQSKSDKENL